MTTTHHYPQVDIREWTAVGAGFNGTAYISHLHPGRLLKIVRSDLGKLENVEQEFKSARKAYEIGIPTPKVYAIVRDGEQYGYTSQIIEGKKSIARLCADQPGRIPEYAALMARCGKQLHATPIPADAYITPVKEHLEKALESSGVLSEKTRPQLLSLVRQMPDPSTCLHGDFQPGNLIVSPEGKHYWIDLGWLSTGFPMLDIAHLYMMLVENSSIPAVQQLTHMTREQMLAFWDCFVKEYAGAEDSSTFNKTLAPYAALDIVLSTYNHPNDNPQFIAFFRSRIAQLLTLP